MSRFSPYFLSLLAIPVAASENGFRSLEEAIDAARYGVQVSELAGSGFPHRMVNPRHGLHCEFTPSGLRMEVRTTGAAEARYFSEWTLVEVGRGATSRAVGEGNVRPAERKIEIARPGTGIVEWFVNGPEGMEHGFDLGVRPLPEIGGALTLKMNIAGDLRPEVQAGGRGLILRDRRGREVATYDKLAVWDASGAELASSLSCGEDGSFVFEIKDAGAIYPIVVDPLLRQQAYVKASNTGAGDAFGFSVAMSGDTAVVGAPNEDSNARTIGGNQANNAAMDAGAVYVFAREDGVWSQEAYLKATNTDLEDDFGYSVDIEGDTIVVGAPDEGSSSNVIDGNEADNTFGSAGAVYVFTRDDEDQWVKQAYLKASNAGAGDQLGYSVSISGDTVLAGAPFEDSNAAGVNGNGANNSASGAGAAHAFVRDAEGVWTQQAYFKASSPDIGDNFGKSVEISGDVAIVGAPAEDSAANGVDGNDDDDTLPNSGAAYVFARSGTTWVQQAYVKAANPMLLDQFGMAVAVSGERVAVGSPQEDGGGTGVNGPSGAAPQSNAGAAYLFRREGGGWAQEAYLKASNTEEFDEFGFALALEGDALAIGARREDGGTTGAGGDQSDNGADSSGAVYVFGLDPAGWKQRVYLKASHTGEGDEFGGALDLSGDSLIVGAELEDSNAVGIDGNGSINSSSASGAAYIFTGIDADPVPLPILGAPEADGNGGWNIRWTSVPGAQYTLERSHDFVTWELVETVVATEFETVYQESAANTAEPTFWRVRSPCD